VSPRALLDSSNRVVAEITRRVNRFRRWVQTIAASGQKQKDQHG